MQLTLGETTSIDLESGSMIGQGLVSGHIIMVRGVVPGQGRAFSQGAEGCIRGQ